MKIRLVEILIIFKICMIKVCNTNYYTVLILNKIGSLNEKKHNHFVKNELGRNTVMFLA